MNTNSKRHAICKFCNGFYDFGSEQPVCSICHAFVYEFATEALKDLSSSFSEQKEASNDSGNEEPERVSDFYPLAVSQENILQLSLRSQINPTNSLSFNSTNTQYQSVEKGFPFQQHGNEINLFQKWSGSSPYPFNAEFDQVPNFYPLAVSQENILQLSLRSQINPTNTLTFNSNNMQHQSVQKECSFQQHGDKINSFRRMSGSVLYHFNRSNANLLEELPTDVLFRILEFLDDVSIWCLRLASRRCCSIIDSDVPEQRWANFVEYRWPIFVPRSRINSWRLLYLNMMESVTCRQCLSRMRSPVLFPVEGPRVRFRRIVSEIKNLCADPPYGIKALALDTDTYAHCLAGIAGPPASPYEGGLFYVHVLVPDSHPMRPPVIRFLTRILHPNISFHGDIGLDCIRHNWSLALTLDKLLLSIQSLLTDPYTQVCMEPVIGELYSKNRDKFEELAKLWTWKFACHDYLSATFVSQLALPDYID